MEEDTFYDIAWTSPTGRNHTIVGNAADTGSWVATFRDKGAVGFSMTRDGVRMDFPDPSLPGKVVLNRSGVGNA